MQKCPNARVDMNHAIFIGCLDDIIRAQATPGFDHVLNFGLTGAVDVVSKGNEGIRPEGDTRKGINPLGPFFSGKWVPVF